VSRQTVNAIETGRDDPSLLLAVKIAELFESSIESLFLPAEDPARHTQHLLARGPCRHGYSPGMSSQAVAKVEAALRAAGVVAEFRSFEKPVPTAAAAAKALGCEVGAIANSLVFTTDGQPLLVLASGAHRVNTTALANDLNIGKIRRATTDFVLTHTGQHIGGVAPVGHPGKVRTVVDTALAEFPVVWAGAGDEHTMFATSYHDLLTATEGAAATVA